MSKIEVLCTMDREMMLSFSRQCFARLDASLPLKLVLAPLQRFFDANVHKEIDKDRLFIEHAADEFEKGHDRSDIDLNSLFEMTKKIDNAFLKSLSNPFCPLEVCYDSLAEIRKSRMRSFINMVFDLLGNWHDASPLAVVVKNTYAEERYRDLLHEILHLYNIETRLLGSAFTLPVPTGRMKDLVAEKLFAAMERTARDVSRAYARTIFENNGSSGLDPDAPQPASSS